MDLYFLCIYMWCWESLYHWPSIQPVKGNLKGNQSCLDFLKNYHSSSYFPQLWTVTFIVFLLHKDIYSTFIWLLFFWYSEIMLKAPKLDSLVSDFLSLLVLLEWFSSEKGNSKNVRKWMIKHNNLKLAAFKRYKYIYRSLELIRTKSQNNFLKINIKIEYIY